MKIAITGTTSGIGLALVEALSLDHEVIELNRSELTQEQDLSNVDILINNAGHSLGGGVGFKEHDKDQWSSIIDTNLMLPIRLTQNFIKQNVKGKIVYITSRSVEMDIGGDSVYAASKSGLSTFIKCMRDELAQTPFKLIEVRPGRVKTNFAKNRQIHSEETLKNFYDIRKHIEVSEIIKIVKFIIDNDCVETITVNS